MNDSDVKRVIVEMFKNKEIIIRGYGNPNVGTQYQIEFNISDEGFYCSEFIDLDEL